TATAASGTQVPATSSFIVAKTNVVTVNSNFTLSATDTTSLDGKTVAVYSTNTNTVELTIAGSHSFARLLVLTNGKVSHAQGIDTTNITTTGTIYVACDGSIDATGRGYVGEQTILGEVASARGSGGSHMGHGGFDSGANPAGAYGSSYGNVKHPSELGGGGGYTYGATGGGRVRLIPNTLVLDGAIRANAANAGNQGGAAGGSVWITAGKISGDGSIEAKAGSGGYSAGGGGAISVEYTDTTSSGAWLTHLNSQGFNVTPSPRNSGAGTVYVKGPSNTFGTLTIDNGTNPNVPTELPSFGTRTVTSLTTNGVRVSGARWVAPHHAGNEVEVTSASGVTKGIVR